MTPVKSIKPPNVVNITPEKLIMPPKMDIKVSEKFRMPPVIIMMPPFFVIFKSDLGMKALKKSMRSIILSKRLPD